MAFADLCGNSLQPLRAAFPPAPFTLPPPHKRCFLSPFYAPEHLVQGWARNRTTPLQIYLCTAARVPWSCCGPTLPLHWDWPPGSWPLLIPPTRLQQCRALPQAQPGQTVPRSLPSQVTPVWVHYSLSWQARHVPHHLKPIKGQRGASGHGSLVPVWVPRLRSSSLSPRSV